MIKLYGNEIWNSNTPNQYKKVIIASESQFESITDALENAGLNYCGYINKNKSYVAVGRATVPNLEKLNISYDSIVDSNNRKYVTNNIIGTTKYNDIGDKMYRKYNTDFAYKVAQRLSEQDIPFSGRIFGKNTTITVDNIYKDAINAIAHEIREQRELLYNDKAVEKNEPSATVKNSVTVSKEDNTENLFNALSVLHYKAHQLESLNSTVELLNNHPELIDTFSTMFEDTSDFKPEQLNMLSMNFVKTYSGLSDSELILANTADFNEIKQSFINTNLADKLIENHGYSYAQSELIRDMVDMGIDYDTINLLDYTFSLTEMQTFIGAYSRSDYDSLINLVSKVKGVTRSEVEGMISDGTYTPALPDFNTLEKTLYFQESEAESITYMYYNPDAYSGGQFVITEVSYKQIAEANKEYGDDFSGFFDFLDTTGEQRLIDIGSESFRTAVKKFYSGTEFAEGLNADIQHKLVELAVVPEIKLPEVRKIELIKVGDFYEVRGENAKTVADILDLVSTTRNINGSSVDTVGFPDFKLNDNTELLKTQGFTVNIKYEGLVDLSNEFNKLISEQKKITSNVSDKHTIVINAFAGPGAGKTTSCLEVAEKLKKQGFVTEYVQEYAKELVYDNNLIMLDGHYEHQFDILKEQVKRINRLYGKVDFILTDSPVLLNNTYLNEDKGTNDYVTYCENVKKIYTLYDNFNYFVERDKSAFEKEGRIHNLEQSIVIDDELKNTLHNNQIDFATYTHSTIDNIVRDSVLAYAKQLINSYCRDEFDSEADFSDLKKVGVAYTTTEDSKHTVEAVVNLVDYRLETYVDDKLFKEKTYSSLKDMIDNCLYSLSFDDLVYLSDDELAQLEPKEHGAVPLAENDYYNSVVKQDLKRALYHIDNAKSDAERNFYQNNFDIKVRNYAGALNVSSEEIVNQFNSENEIVPINEPEQTESVQEIIRPTITCDWSESPVFENGKTYSVSEFDKLMKNADDEWVEQRQLEIEEYGSENAVTEAYRNGELDNIHLGYEKTKFIINMPNGTKYTERQDIGDGIGGVIDFLEQYPQYSDVVKLLKDDIAFENRSNELLKPLLAFDEQVAIVNEFFDYEKAWHNVDDGISEIAEKYRNGDNIDVELAKHFINHYTNLNSAEITDDYEIQITSDGVSIQNSQFFQAYNWDTLGTHYFKYLYDTFNSIKEEQAAEYPEKESAAEEINNNTELHSVDELAMQLENDEKSTSEKSSVGKNNFIWTSADEHAPVTSQPTLFDSMPVSDVSSDETTSHENYVLEDRESVTGAKTKYRNNITAIKVLKQIEAEYRTATPEEQKQLSLYSGWGGLANAFESDNDKWKNEYSELKGLLTDEEYTAARSTVLDSFYTDTAIVDSIYEVIRNAGFEDGNILEPAMGVGNFFGRLPEELRDKVNLYGVEKDSLSGRIAQKLYPQADITIDGLENTRFNDNSFDVAIGNIPFGDFSVNDSKYNSKHLKIHDYFFLKSLDKVRDGGIVAFVTSKGTLDKKDSSFRKTLAERADLVGAVRLPNNAFKSAGTEVTADIIFLQKREKKSEIEPSWVHTGQLENGLTVNNYFVEHPEMILGEVVEGNKMFGRTDDTMCVPFNDGRTLSELLSSAVKNINFEYSASAEKLIPVSEHLTAEPLKLRLQSFYRRNGEIYFYGSDKSGKIVNVSADKALGKKLNHERINSFIDIRDTLRELLDVQQYDNKDSEIAQLQEKLNNCYDSFYSKYGLLHSSYNHSLLNSDGAYPLVASLEADFAKDNNLLVKKSDIFTERVNKPTATINHVDTADEAHEFKNLYCATKLQNVSGISSRASQRATELFAKCRYLDEKTGGKGVVFATGTPLSNSVTELHTMMRYLNYDFLASHNNMQNFDNWISAFGVQKKEYELAPAGNKFKERTRIAEYSNLPELMSMFKMVADVKTAETLKLKVPDCELHIVDVEPTELQKELVDELSDRADEVNSGSVDPSQDNMLKITGDGRKLGLDPRLISPDFEDNPNTKLNVCVNNVFDIYTDTAKDKLTQIVFCDLGVPSKNTGNDSSKEQNDNKSVAEIDSLEETGKFCVYDDIRDKLIAKGVPASEIAYIHNAKTEAQKSELFSKVRSGEVRILLGSTGKMGTGTNVQDRIIALHDLDVPWRPADLEQRRGRMVRQGNINEKVHLYRYVTKGTFDAYSYQLLETKQKFISQVMTDKAPARKCADVDQAALSYGEIKALCTGDDRIREKLTLDNRVKELNSLKADYNNTKYELEDGVAAYPEKRKQLLCTIGNIKSDIDNVKSFVDKDGKLICKLTLGSQTFDLKNDEERKNAAKALTTAVAQVRIADNRKKQVGIGNICGFDISVINNGNVYDDIVVTIKGKYSYSAQLGVSAVHNLSKIEGLLYKTESVLDYSQNSLNKLDLDYKTSVALLEKPFEYEAELQEKSARLSELTKILNIELAHQKTESKPKTHYFGKDKILGRNKSSKQIQNKTVMKSEPKRSEPEL